MRANNLASSPGFCDHARGKNRSLRNGLIKTLNILLVLCLVSLTGCGTFIARLSSNASGSGTYQGTSANVALLTTYGARGYDGYATIFCWFTIVCPVVAIVTLPADVVVDTVMLPVDA